MRKALQYYLSTGQAVKGFIAWYGSTLKTPEKIEDDQKENLLGDLITVFERCNRSDDETAIVENTNLLTIIHF